MTRPATKSVKRNGPQGSTGEATRASLSAVPVVAPLEGEADATVDDSADDSADDSCDATRSTKRALRAEIRTAIQSIHPLQRAFKSRAVSDFIVRAPPLAGRGLLLAYRALRDEVCIDAAIASLVTRGWRVAFPSIDANGTMQLIELTVPNCEGAIDPFMPGHWTLDRHAIRAPRLDAAHSRRIRTREIDAVFVPARAFDRAGNRLGRGQGHYDRLLAALRPDTRACTVGVAFAEQLVESVPVDPHDRPVSWIATDHGILRSRRS